MRRLLRTSGFAIALAAPLLATPVMAEETAPARKHVLLVYPFDRFSYSNVDVDLSIRNELEARLAGGVDFSTEFLDLIRVSSSTQQHRLAELLREKYRDRRLDLVIALNVMTVDYLLPRRDQLFPGVPVVFLVDDSVATALPPDVGGIIANDDPRRTIDFALRLRPDTRRVVVISGTSTMDRHWLAQTQRALLGYPALRVSIVDDSTLPDLLDLVRRLPDQSIIYLPSFLQDAAGRRYRSEDVAREIAAVAKAPVFSMQSTLLGSGAVGGFMSSHTKLGAAVARLGAETLLGREPVGVVRADNSFAYRADARQLRRWAMSQALLPPGTELNYVTPSFWRQYRGRIIAMLVMLVIQTALISALLIGRAQRARDMKEIQQLNAEVMLQASELQTLIDVAPVAIEIAHDPRGLRLTANAAFDQMFGPELRGALLGKGQPERGGATFLRGGRETLPNALPMARAINEAVAVRGEEFEVRFADGRLLSIYGSALPVRDENGAIAGCIGAFVDITGRKRADLELQEQRRELAHLSRVAALGELSGALAHELSQPLTSILANVEAAQRMIARGLSDLSEVQAALSDIREADLRANDVLARTRSLMKNEPVRKSLLEVNDVVEKVLDLTRGELLTRGVVARTLLSRALPRVLGDPIQLQQVLLNLVINACDAMFATPPEDRRLVVATRINEQGLIQIQVKDRGTGIPDGQLESIFRPFFTSKQKGLGLGLSICQSIIMDHGGRLTASNNSDRGVTFTITLPRAIELLSRDAAPPSAGAILA